MTIFRFSDLKIEDPLVAEALREIGAAVNRTDATLEDLTVSSGVSSFNGRTGAVSPLQADYDSFFLTQAEADALYLSINAFPLSNSEFLQGEQVDTTVVDLIGVNSSDWVELGSPTHNMQIDGTFFKFAEGTGEFRNTAGVADVGITWTYDTVNNIFKLTSIGSSIISFSDGTSEVLRLASVVQIRDGVNFRVYDIGNTDAIDIGHDGVDAILNGINSTNLNITGFTALDVTGAIIASGNITGANLNISNWDTAFSWGNHAGLYEPIDAAIVKSDEAETITAAWNFQTVQIDFLAGTDIVIWEAAGIDNLRISDNGTNAVYSRVNGLHTFSQGISVTGDVAGTTIGGITQANLVDKAATETISGAWTIGGVLSSNLVDKSAVETITGAWTYSALLTANGGIRLNNDDRLEFGAAGNVLIDWDSVGSTFDLDSASNYIWRLLGGPRLRLFDSTDTDYTEFEMLSSNGLTLKNALNGINFQYAGSDRLRTAQINTTGGVSGAEVNDHGGTWRKVGFNVLPTFNFGASDTLEAQHCGKATGKTGTGAITITGPTSSDVDFPVGGLTTIMNLNSTGNITISDTATCTMFYCDGTSVTDIVGSGTLSPGGILNIYRFSTTAIYLWGIGFTP